ncbi:MAG: magnesium/cobalt efflux protein, partial [Gammaproteobacteria bacterium]|nr:magnesium/cobalt efflux protein [Gammaproteobacteria bacterium]
STLVDASITIRDLNRTLHWQLPSDGARTLSGAIIEYLETIPQPKTCLRLSKYAMEIIQLQDQRIKTVRIYASY